MIKKISELNVCLCFIRDTYLQTIKNEDSALGQSNFINHYVGGDETAKNFSLGLEIYFGYYLNEELVGVISIDKTGYIKFLFVSKKAQNKGVGNKLLLYVENHARKKQYKAVRLDSSLNGIGFYLSNGYRIVGQECKMDDIWFQPMIKELQ